ncbi:MAG: thioredoxin family protein [Sulfobacillus sp.]
MITMAIPVQSDDEFARLTANAAKKYALDFTATWCGPCKAFSPAFERLAQENPWTTFLKVDIDRCQRVASNFGVDSVPTLVIIDQGKVVYRQSGADATKFAAALRRT